MHEFFVAFEIGWAWLVSILFVDNPNGTWVLSSWLLLGSNVWLSAAQKLVSNSHNPNCSNRHFPPHFSILLLFFSKNLRDMDKYCPLS